MTADSLGKPGRSVNRRAALNELLVRGPMTRVGIARSLALSKPTVSLLVGELEAANLVIPLGLIEGRVGRAATRYAIRPDAAAVLAVDLSRSLINMQVAGLGSDADDLEALVEEPQRSSAQALLAQIAEMAKSLTVQAGLQRAATRVLSVAMPGVVDPRSGRVALAPNLPDFGDMDVRATLENLTQCHVVLTNDVNAAALGEGAHGHASGVQDFAFFFVGPGVGAGLVLEGRLRNGPTGAAGEIGWLPIPAPLDGASHDNSRGALESALTSAALVRDYQTRRGSRTRSKVTAAEILTRASAGDGAALESADAFSALLARAIAALVATLDLPLVILGGELASDGHLVPLVNQHLSQLLPVLPKVTTSALGQEAALIGSASIGAAVATDALLELATNP